MRKRLVLSLDAGSFPIGSPVAARLGAVSGTVDIDVDAVLLMIAYVTRPPAIYGFSLADAWAWLRYRQAIARTRRLRLKAEWTDLDQHQKAVLSDEMGVGFTTYFLQGVFDVRIWVETNWFLKTVAPPGITLGRTSKRGPTKSPDYIGMDAGGSLNILECKGTQSSLRALTELMDTGVDQKENVKSSGGSIINSSLVGGLFIPQWDKSEDACLRFADPDASHIVPLLERAGPERARLALMRLAYAKFFALLNIARTANALALTPLDRRLRLSDEVFRGPDLPAIDEDGFLALSRDHSIRPGIRGSQTIRFSIRYPAEELHRLQTVRDTNEWLLQQQRLVTENGWSELHLEQKTILKTPLGFVLELEVLVS